MKHIHLYDSREELDYQGVRQLERAILLVLETGSLAWKTSWTTGQGVETNKGDGDERNVKVLKLDTLKVLKELQVTENSVAQLRIQVRFQRIMFTQISGERNFLMYWSDHPNVLSPNWDISVLFKKQGIMG